MAPRALMPVPEPGCFTAHWLMDIGAIAVVSGPDAGRIINLGATSDATIGRAAELRVDDPRCEVVHAGFDRAGGAITPLGGHVRAATGGDHLIGASTLRLIADPPTLEPRIGPVIERPIRAQQPFDGLTPVPAVPEQQTAAPSPRTVGTGPLIGAAVGIGGASMIAVVTGNAMFMLIGSIGALTALATWTVDVIRSRRERRRERVTAAERRNAEIDQMIADHEQRTVALRHVWPLDLAAIAGSSRVWERRRGHGDLLRVVIAIEPDYHGAIEHLAAPAPAVPCIVDLASIRALAIVASPSISSSVLRSIVGQLVVATGPADLMIEIDQSVSLREFRDLPHQVPGGSDDRHRVIIGADPAELSDPSTRVRQALDGSSPVTVIVAISPGQPIPAAIHAIFEIDGQWRAEWTPNTARPEDRRALTAAVGMSGDTAARVAAHLDGLIDPELTTSSQHLPTRVDLGSLLERTSVDRPSNRSLDMIVGVGEDGTPVMVDLVRDGPHALVAGTTGSGKSELLRAMVVSAARRHDPDDLNIALIDFKGGAAFDSLASLPHVVGTLTDLDGHAAGRVLTGLTAELRRREEMLREGEGSSTIPRLLIVIDEFAELAAADPDASRAMLGIARRGRSLGVHLVIATQRPSGVVNDEVRANTDLRFCLRVNSTADSIDVIGDPAAAQIERAAPGRAVLAIAGRGIAQFQTALVSDGDIGSLRARRSRSQLRRPWQEPLPNDLPPADDGDFGLVDRPETQSNEPLHWQPERGSLLISGDPGTGRTTALRTVLAGTPHPIHFITARVGEADAFFAAHVGEAIQANDTERVRRLLRHLHRELSRRRDGRSGDRLVLALDGIDTVISEFERLGDEDTISLLRALINDSASLGISIVATTRSLHRLADVACVHWLLHRADSGAAQHLGAPAALLPPKIPGRILRLPDPAQAHIRRPPPRVARRGVSAPARVEVLPSRTSRIHPVGAQVERGVRLELGIDADDLSPVDITLTGGRHVLVIGGRGTGRTTALDWIGESWRSITGAPPARVRHSLDELPESTPGLVIVDDALAVDAGASADRIRNDPGVVLVAATDGDGLRAAWGHWLGDLRRWRTGLVIASGGALDGDLLGATLPARTPIAARPGLGWWVADGQTRLLQVHAGPDDQSTTLHPSPMTSDDMLAR